MSFKGEVRVAGESTFTANAQRFATEVEAQNAVNELAGRWMAVEEVRVVDAGKDIVNYRCRVPGARATPITLATYAKEIRADWSNVYFGAVPYLDAMASMDVAIGPGLKEAKYGYDDALGGIVLYFLSNAKTWRGEVAKQIKAELNALYKAYG